MFSATDKAHHFLYLEERSFPILKSVTMSSLADALVSKVLGHTAAERAFRPWWDNFEDYLVYALVMLGKSLANVKPPKTHVKIHCYRFDCAANSYYK